MIVVFIGEGETERRFMPELLVKQAGFMQSEMKANHWYEKNEHLQWMFPFEPGIATGGRDRFRKPDTYRVAQTIAENQSHDILRPVYNYVLLRDMVANNIQAETVSRNDIQQALARSGILVGVPNVYFSKTEIECWYFAGLMEDFPYVKSGMNNTFNRLVNSPSETIPDPKGQIKECLEDSHVGIIRMANAVAEHFSIQKARDKSESFNTFWGGLESQGLI
jgi:hypothetical protein